MNRRKLFLVLAAVVLVAFAVRPGSALCGLTTCGCVCLPGGGTAGYVGSGSSCSQASASAKSQAFAEVTSDCSPDGFCSRTYVVDTACYWDSAAQVYKEEGEARFRCSYCE
jgi:hypothetical protein